MNVSLRVFARILPSFPLTKPSDFATRNNENPPQMSWKAFLSRNLQGLKFMACPKTPSSAGVRDFWINNYAEIKHLNPRFPFMIRGVGEIDPYVLVEYGACYARALPAFALRPPLWRFPHAVSQTLGARRR